MEKSGGNANKLTGKTKFTYGIGQIGDSLPYNLFSLYFLFYLTDVVGMLPTIAGFISMLAVVWNAVANPVVGYLTDNCKSRYGRRRPYMLAGIPLIILAVILMFMPVKLQGAGQTVYFLLVAMLFWTAYVVYVIPYGSLGAEITQDYNERSSLRAYNQVFGYLVLMLVSSGPMIIQSIMLPKGATPQNAWTVTAIIFAVLIAIFGLACWRGLRGKELKAAQEMNQQSQENIFKTFKETFQIRAYRILILMIVLYVIGASIINTGMVYLLTYAAGFSTAQQSVFWIIYCLIIIAGTPFIVKLAARFGKKQTVIGSSLALIVISLVFCFIVGIHSAATMYSFAALGGLSCSCFWMLYVSLMYDICEVDEWKNHQRREGTLTAIMLFVQKIGTAFSVWMTGVLLSAIGYQAGAVQSPETVKGIVMICTLGPALFIAISMIVFSRYPLTQKRFEAVKTALALRKEGKECSDEEFKEVL